ncbi:DUF7344 domain-containing protein [Natronorubrum thiooxidans]|uniref:DUF7344 domain-containing protein n=1 Tax=Natronorubrum thiooxidans TaxID=308853 RepID=A0A1N7DNK3_9EURY|nr:transcriptional regulator [Natronorubrum thiooxidans]SIR77295.1 hypothetical protein SAMN05421752_102394 [Natronorubrum thiooxidans]
MSSDAHPSGASKRDSLENIPAECYDVFRHPRRIRLLKILSATQTRLSLTELTTALVESEGIDGSNEQTRDDVRISLMHTHLPRLADNDIIEWDTETGVALASEHPLPPADLASLLELCERKNCDRLLEVLVHPVRIGVFSMVSDSDQPLSVKTLASKLAARNVGSLSDSKRAMVLLHHTHLPMLADVGVLEFDHESGVVMGDEQAMSIVQ